MRLPVCMDAPSWSVWPPCASWLAAGSETQQPNRKQVFACCFFLFKLWFISELLKSFEPPDLKFQLKTATWMCSVSLRVPQRGPGFGDGGQHRYWWTAGLPLRTLRSPDCDYSEKRESITAGGVVSVLEHWHSAVIFSYSSFFYSPPLHIYCLRSLITTQVAEKCLSLGAQKALYLPADMSSDSDPAKVVDFALDKLGGLDYLVLNHIGATPFTMWKGDVEHTKWLMQVLQQLVLFSLFVRWKKCIDLSLCPSLTLCICVCVCFPKVNFFSYIQMAWRALPSLEQSKGSLIIVSSLLGTFLNK